jgi:hypothetical protein
MIKKYKYHLLTWTVILIGWIWLGCLLTSCKETRKPYLKENKTVDNLQQYINKLFKETSKDTLIFYNNDNSMSIILRKDPNKIKTFYKTYSRTIILDSK